MSRLSLKWTPERPYEETHPWLMFAFHAEDLQPAVLAQLGAIQAKCHWLVKLLLPPAISEELHSIYLAKGVHGSTAIEGNSLSEDDVRGLIKKEKELPKSLEYQKQEVENILRACNEIKANILAGDWDSSISPQRIMEFNRWVLEALPQKDERIVPGQIRTYPVGVFDYVAPDHRFCDDLLSQLCEWLNTLRPLGEGCEIVDAILRAIIAHIYIAWIHPFGDGNGRCARLVELNILISCGVPSLAAHLLSNHYNQTRPQYFEQLSNASKTTRLEPFIAYAVQGFLDQLKEQQDAIDTHLDTITWKDFVHTMFHEIPGDSARRRRNLALALGILHPSEWVSKKALVRMTPDLAAAYADKTPKTLSRDLNDLQERGLVEIKKGAVMASLERLEAFRTECRRD